MQTASPNNAWRGWRWWWIAAADADSMEQPDTGWCAKQQFNQASQPSFEQTLRRTRVPAAMPAFPATPSGTPKTRQRVPSFLSAPRANTTPRATGLARTGVRPGPAGAYEASTHLSVAHASEHPRRPRSDQLSPALVLHRHTNDQLLAEFAEESWASAEP